MNNKIKSMEFYTDKIFVGANDRCDDGYEHLLKYIRESFDEEVNNGKEPLFVTDIENLYDVFLDNLPIEARQHYNCRACRNFVNRYGVLVRVKDTGETEPIMWKYTSLFFCDAVNAVREAVKKAKISGVFITSEKRLGIPKTGVWHHMAVDTPKSMIFTSRLITPNQASAEKLEDFRMLLDSVHEYRIETVETAVNLLRSDSMYRGEKVLGVAEWFLDILNEVKNGNRYFTNILWKKAATAPNGFCHISSSMIGTLLDDIKAGHDIETIKRKFNEKMNPLRYQRPQAAPKIGNVAQAEKIVAKLGIEQSLKRRFARIDEIKTIWKPSTDSSASIGVFSDIKTREATKKSKDPIIPSTVMTWEKFFRTVLHSATKIELYVDYAPNNYAAMCTAVDMDAPPIIQWDTDEPRNPFNWYVYNGGSSPARWNIPSGYVEVTGVTLQPNMWQTGYDHQGYGVFFLLKGCKDTLNSASALFPEVLRSDLREVRATIEAYSARHKLEGLNEASACGLICQSATKQWRCKLRVTTDIGTHIYNLDRWD